MKSNLSKSKITRRILDRDLENLRAIVSELGEIIKSPSIDESNFARFESIEDSIRLLRASFIRRFIFIIRQGEEKVD